MMVPRLSYYPSLSVPSHTQKWHSFRPETKRKPNNITMVSRMTSTGPVRPRADQVTWPCSPSSSTRARRGFTAKSWTIGPITRLLARWFLGQLHQQVRQQPCLPAQAKSEWGLRAQHCVDLGCRRVQVAFISATAQQARDDKGLLVRLGLFQFRRDSCLFAWACFNSAEIAVVISRLCLFGVTCMDMARPSAMRRSSMLAFARRRACVQG
jgi:hypothetical protein